MLRIRVFELYLKRADEQWLLSMLQLLPVELRDIYIAEVTREIAFETT